MPVTRKAPGAAGRAARACGSASSASRWSIRRAPRPRSRSSPRPPRRSRPSSAASSARRWSNRPIRCGQRDPDVEQMTVDFRKALARLVPVFMPDLLFRLRPRRHAGVQGVRRGDRADRVHAGQGLRHAARCSRSTIASSWRRAGSRRPSNLDLATIQQQELAITFRFHISQYLTRRAADWKAQGLHRDARRLGRAQRALEVLGRRPARRVQELGGGRRPAQSARPAPGRQRAHHAARAAAPRRHDGDPGEQARRAGAPAHAVAAGADRRTPISTTSSATCAPESLYGPNAGLTEVLIPAGYVTTVYDPVFALSAGRHALRVAGRPTRRPRSRRPGCRSRWCSAPSPARRTCCCGSPRPTRPPRSAAFRRRPSGRSDEGCGRRITANSVR